MDSNYNYNYNWSPLAYITVNLHLDLGYVMSCNNGTYCDKTIYRMFLFRNSNDPSEHSDIETYNI